MSVMGKTVHREEEARAGQRKDWRGYAGAESGVDAASVNGEEEGEGAAALTGVGDWVALRRGRWEETVMATSEKRET